jgi:hypothetical protein
VDHPTRKTLVTIRKGKNAGQSYERAERVMSAEPDLNPELPVIPMPKGLQRLVLLGDGDSEPVATGNALKRAKVRYRSTVPQVLIKTAASGKDFNDVLRGL